MHNRCEKLKEQNRKLKEKIDKLKKIFCLNCYKKLPKEKVDTCPYCGIPLWSKKTKRPKKERQIGWIDIEENKELKELFKRRRFF